MLNINWIMPEILLTASIVILLGYTVVYSKIGGKFGQRNKIKYINIFVLLTLIPLLVNMIYDISDININIKNQLSISVGVLIIKLIIVLTTLIIMWLSKKEKAEWYILILLSTLGLMIFVSSIDLIMLYLGIELISLSLYVLAAIKRDNKESTEAGLKYFILGAMGSGILLMGSAIIYIGTGKTNFYEISLYGKSEIIIIGGLLIVMALLFKLAAAPFHMWAPDVYDGAPTIVTAYFAIVPKVGILIGLSNLLYICLINIIDEIQPLVLVSGLMSTIIGSIAAINQTKFKRILAYSAIGHMGFMLLGIGVGTYDSFWGSLIYIVVYIIMSINIFTIVLTIYKDNEKEYIGKMIGISRKNVVLGYTVGITLLSMAGIPPLIGFISKYIIIVSVMKSEHILIGVIAILMSVISGYYYLRIIQYIFFKDTQEYKYREVYGIIEGDNKISIEKSIILGGTIYLIMTLILMPKLLTTMTFTTITSILI